VWLSASDWYVRRNVANLRIEPFNPHEDQMWIYKVTQGPYYDADATMALPEPY